MLSQKDFDEWAMGQGFNVDKNEFGQYYNSIVSLIYGGWNAGFLKGNDRVLNALEKQDIDPSFKNRILTQLHLDM